MHSFPTPRSKNCIARVKYYAMTRWLFKKALFTDVHGSKHALTNTLWDLGSRRLLVENIVLLLFISFSEVRVTLIHLAFVSSSD